ncbi:ABC transporter [Carpediemonas membranifera]|uniref:ABC transporter n=1 Tax=Carpediemonas membranifera TaxID=201153 RepID=A0A8J6BFA1_9EUKA|nr:ABC transporter [Carpediemonas membranifera]|eukprot:KAG9396252.1 ABC transporter [Carpediemonas membranifera]
MGRKARKEARQAELVKAAVAEVTVTPGTTTSGTVEEPVVTVEVQRKQLQAEDPIDTSLSVTGKLATRPTSNDVKITSYSLQAFGQTFVDDSTLDLSRSRIGLLGHNASGSTTLLRSIAEREIPIPEHLDIFFLDREAPPVDMTPVEFLTEDTKKVHAELEAEANKIVLENPNDPRLSDLYERIEETEPDLAIAKATRLLMGLQVNKRMRGMKCHEFSGGWRMRVALAKALMFQPAILLLDDPTAHLDLEAVIWLEQELSQFPNCMVLVSHSADFLDAVCNKICVLENKKLSYYNGNYTTFLRAKKDRDIAQMSSYNREQAQIKSLQSYIDKYGHGDAKHVKQAKSREKKIARMEEAGLTDRVTVAKTVTFQFPPCTPLPPPVLQINNVRFGYPNSAVLYENLWSSLDMDSRVCLVGPNGSGKSTLMKLFARELHPLAGQVVAHTHCRVGHYHQHLADALDLRMTPLEFIASKDTTQPADPDRVRSLLGQFDISGTAQTMSMARLSGGQLVRVCFAWLAVQQPNILLLDEPSNGLDLDTIDALASAINAFEGGVLVISHDFRLVNQIAKEIWICDNGQIVKFPSSKTIMDYKEDMRKGLEVKLERRKRVMNSLGAGRK